MIDDELIKAQHDVLILRDRLIGLEAENGTLRQEIQDAYADAEAAHAQLHKITVKQRATQAKLDDARERLKQSKELVKVEQRRAQQLKTSLTWRIGRVFVAPFAIFRRS